MPAYLVGQIQSKAGIQRDGTDYDSVNFIDGQHCRFYKGRPRKMGGYSTISLGSSELIRDMYSVPKDNTIDLYQGRASSLVYLNIDFNGVINAEVERTPTSNFTPDPLNAYSFDQFVQAPVLAGTETTYIVAHVAKNAENINNQEPGFIFYGDINAVTPLTTVTTGIGLNPPVKVSGGVIFVTPYLIAYGNGGQIEWSEPGDITQWPTVNKNTIGNTKLVKALNSRGGTLFWSLNELIRVNLNTSLTPATFVGTPVENITLMSPDSVVSYNQMFFWIGTDQFYSYNGIVQKLPNTMNSDWFFQHIYLPERSKVWGMVVSRYSEIWWFYPRITLADPTPTECNAVIIYNIDDNCWYDTMLSRSCGVPVSVMPYPIMADSALNPLTLSYPLWLQETTGRANGNDKVIGGDIFAIKSYFTTHLIDLWSENPQNSRLLRNRRIAPDFVQQEEMTVSINTSFYPNSRPVVDGPHPFAGVPYDVLGFEPPYTYPEQLIPPQLPYVDFATQGGLVSFTFQSYQIGGYYQAGKSLYIYDIGDTLK